MSASDQSPARAHLNVPLARSANYARNFIKQAVCELRFPTLYELEAARPPVSFAQALRKEYPIQELMETVNLGGGSLPARANVHSFRSKRQRWTVTLGAAFVKLETLHYGAFAEFKERLALVLKAAAPVIDSDYFTRVGLRYINSVPYVRERIDQWVNPGLVGPLAGGIYAMSLSTTAGSLAVRRLVDICCNMELLSTGNQLRQSTVWILTYLASMFRFQRLWRQCKNCTI